MHLLGGDDESVQASPAAALAGGAGAHYEMPPEKEGEKPVVQMIPESSNYDESIIPEKKDDVEVVINNAQIEDAKVGILDSEKK